MDRSSPSKTREPSIITPPVSQLTPSATGNFLLFIQSEYGNPTPQKGYTTYKKDENIRCEIEKEIIINEMEKVVCVGYKGNGSISGGNLNKTSFSITQDTTLEWLWQKKLVEKDFVLEFDEQEVEIKDVLNISVKASYYGGLKESIKITIDGLPEFISVSIDKELTYIEREAIITFKKVGDMLAGEYKVIINAQCGNLEKNYELNFISKGKVKKTVIKNKDSVLINLKSVENLELADLFQMKLSFPSDKLTICKILPETVIYKNIDKNIMAFTGDFKGDFISIYFDIKKSFSDILPLKIESLVIRDKNKNKIPISITE